VRLKKNQKEKLLAWISEGLQSDEINDRAAQFDDPFSVTRSQVQFYRERRAVDIKTIQAAGEYDALTTGLALRAERVRRLQQLAALMEKDLFGGFLWVVDYEEFNTAEVQQYRGVLDDIAKEVGDRKQSVQHGGMIAFVVDIDSDEPTEPNTNPSS
jgi:hypothetical protein